MKTGSNSGSFARRFGAILFERDGVEFAPGAPDHGVRGDQRVERDERTQYRPEEGDRRENARDEPADDHDSEAISQALA